MQTYLLHPDLPPVSRIAYGCMALGGEWGPEPYPDSVRRQNFELLEAAVEAGINLFDHADIYRSGKSEQVFGEFLRANPGLREKLVIQTKCGIRDGFYDFDPDYLIRSVEGSLARLGLEQIDCLLLHRPDLLAQPEAIASAFDRLHRAGKVRAFGVSNCSAIQIQLLQAATPHRLCSNQIELSLNHHRLISDGAFFNTGSSASNDPSLTFCQLQGLRVQAYSPLGRGRLLGPSEGWTEAERSTRQSLEQLARHYSVDCDAILIAWLLRHPAGIQPILGTSQPARLESACRADAIRLEHPEWYRLLQDIRGEAIP